jgi:hypothetical protein
MINISPKDYSSRISLITGLSEHISEIDNIDFYKMIDSSVEGAEDFADEVNSSMKKPLSKATNEIEALWRDLKNDIYQDFDEKFNSYLFLVSHKIEDLDDFPFREWQNSLDLLKDKPSLDYEQILNNIDKIAEINKDVAAYNIASFLNAIQYYNLEINGLFPHLNMIVAKHFPQASLTNLLSGNNYSSFVDALEGKEIATKENSHLFFEYAAYLPIENVAIKRNMSRHLNNTYKAGFPYNSNKEIHSTSLGLNIPINVEEMDDVYAAFEKTDVWQRIKTSENFQKVFVKNLAKIHNASMSLHHINNVDKFVNSLSKDDVNLAECFFTELEKLIYGTDKENAKTKFHNALKISLKCVLDKEIPQSEIKVKKPKI